MKLSARCIRRWPGIFLFTIIILVFFALCAHAAEPMVVRIGAFDYNGLYGKDENGNPYGYAYEYEAALARHAGFKYKYIYGSWSECLEMLKAGEIDMLNAAQWTSERAELFTYSKYSTGVNFGKIFVKSDNRTIAYNDFEAMEGMRLGLLKGSIREASYRRFAQKNGFSATEIFYDTAHELAAALQSGEVDAIATSSLRYDKNERAVARFDPMPFYFIMDKNNTALHEAVNDAMEQLLIENTNFTFALNTKYYPTDNSVFVLTKKEQDYIKNSPTTRVVYDSYWPPFESYSEADGQPHGINVDIFKLIAEKTGLKVEFLHGYSYETAIAAVGAKSADMLLSYESNPQKANEENILLSNTFLSSPIAIVGKEYRVSPASIFAVPGSYIAHMNFVEEHFPNNKIVTYSDISECYQAIKDGKADFTLENVYAATDAIQGDRYSELVIASVTPQMDSFSFAMRKDVDPILIDILNKAIATISASEINSLLLSYTMNNVTASELELMRQYRRNVTIALTAAAALVILSLLGVIFIQTKNKKTLWNMAYIDELTGHSNYNKFKKDAALLLAHNKDTRYVCSFVDIDNFKLINEMHGFANGDAVLKKICEMLTGILDGKNGTFARTYSDHFVTIKSAAKDEDINLSLAKHEHAIGDYVEKELGYRLTFRLGRYFTHAGETDIVSILEKANYAHGIAKGQSHSNICYYDDAMRQLEIREKEIENKMEAALKSGQFKIYLQAKYSLADETIVGAEALVRWQEDERDLIYPSEFIPLFEKNGFVVKLDMFMFEKACEIIKGWRDKGLPLVTVSVNFSRIHLKNEHFVEEIIAIANRFDVPKKYLEVEITESTMLDSEVVLEDTLTKLHAAGFTLSMDDFGTGYSSLGLLKNLPVDVIKIDRSFFTENKYKDRTKTVIMNVIKMAKELGIATVAEGVESFEHIEFLREIGCEAVQGYYYAKPIAAAAFSVYTDK